jgi:hypothetical protein
MSLSSSQRRQPGRVIIVEAGGDIQIAMPE